MGVSITLNSARTQIENAIVDALAWAYGARLPAVADIATLRATASASIPDRRMRVVTAKGLAYQWRVGELSADDGNLFVQPSDVPAGLPGRWCQQSSTGVTSAAASGYLLRSDNYNDDEGNLETFVERLFGSTPAMLLSYERTDREHKSSGVVGAIDWCKARFTLFAVVSDARAGQAARQGSPVASEAASQPGTASMLGDAMVALKGANLGIDDVAYVEVGDSYPVVKDLARGRFIEALELTVYYTETLPDPSVVPLSYPHTFNVTYKSADLDGSGNMDTANDVMSGLQFPLGDGLTKSFAGGTVNVNGVQVTISGAAHTFPASAVVYRDVDSTGALYYTSTVFGDPAPALGYGRVRLGVTATDATGVRLDRLLAASLITLGTPPDQYDQPTPIASIALSPPGPLSLPAGTPVQFTATGTDADGNPRDVTYLVTWQFDDNGDTTAQPDGVITKASVGTVHITATLNGVTSGAVALTAT